MMMHEQLFFLRNLEGLDRVETGFSRILIKIAECSFYVNCFTFLLFFFSFHLCRLVDVLAVIIVWLVCQCGF